MKNKKIIFLSVVVLLVAAGCSNKKSDAKISTSSSSSISSTKSSTTSTTNSTILESKAVENSEVDQNGETGSNAQQPTITDGDLDIEAINNGDFSTLVGTWKNGKGNIIKINADGSTDKYGLLHAVKDSDKTSKIPYVGINGAALGL